MRKVTPSQFLCHHPIPRLSLITAGLLGTLCLVSQGQALAECDVGASDLKCGTSSNATNDRSTALGAQTIAGNRGTAVGYNARGSGFGSIALGTFADAIGEYAVAIGSDIEGSTARGAEALGIAAVAIGVDSKATASGATALGREAAATNSFSTALGVAAQASGIDSTAVGNESSASGGGSMAVGIGAEATGSGSTAVGRSAEATGFRSTALGDFSGAIGKASIALGGDGVDGDISGARAAADYAIAIGPDARALGAHAITIGDSSFVGGDRSIAIGQLGDTGTFINSVAVGYDASTSGNNGTALGGQSTAALAGTAVGAAAEATGTNSMAFGRKAKGSGAQSAAFGFESQATGTSAFAFGAFAQATANQASAFGWSAVSDVPNQIVFGSGNATVKIPGLAGAGTRTLVVDPTGVVSAIAPPMLATTSRGYSASNQPSLSTTAAVSDTSAQIRELYSMIKEAAKERATLVNRINSLEQQLASAKDELALSGVAQPPVITISTKQLIEVGFEKHTATELVTLNEQVQTDLLELHNKAGREGWIMSDEYRHGRTRLLTTENKLRLELGDDEYQQYLESTQQPWQLIVDAVISDSAAAIAGLQPGDRIHSYSGQRVFTFSELRLLALQGVADEQTEITVIRQDQPVQLYIERGPLGVAVSSGGSLAAYESSVGSTRAL